MSVVEKQDVLRQIVWHAHMHLKFVLGAAKCLHHHIVLFWIWSVTFQIQRAQEESLVRLRFDLKHGRHRNGPTMTIGH